MLREYSKVATMLDSTLTVIEDDRRSLYDEESAFRTDGSVTTSITSSIYARYIGNGRKYQTVRGGEYWGPSDEKQMETMEAV